MRLRIAEAFSRRKESWLPGKSIERSSSERQYSDAVHEKLLKPLRLVIILQLKTLNAIYFTWVVYYVCCTQYNATDADAVRA